MRHHRALAAAVILTVIGLVGWFTPQLADVAGRALPTGPDPSSTGAPGSPVVGLGDSVMSGSQCDCATFLSTYATELGRLTGLHHDAINLGVDGLTADDLWQSLRTDPATRSAVSGADVIVVTVGANDLSPAVARFESADGCDESCIGAVVEPMERALSDSLDVVHVLRKPGALVLVTNYWNVYAVGPALEADFGPEWAGFSESMTARANASIAAVTAAHGDTVVDLLAAFGAPADQPALLLEDGDHPNAAGSQRIAEALLAATTHPVPAGH